MDTQINKKAKGLISAAAVVGASVILSKAMGLFRDILIAGKWGTGTEAVAYDTASRIPVILYELITGGAVSTALIPVYKEISVKRGKREAQHFSSRYINLITLLCVITAVFGMIFADGLVALTAPELSDSSKKLTAALTRIMCPTTVFTGIAFSYTGILQSMGEFYIPSITSAVSNAVSLIYLYTLGDVFGVTGLAAGTLLGWVMQTLIQLPKLHGLGWSYSFGLGIADPYVKKAVKYAFPIIIGAWTQPICSIVNTRFASGICGGRAITALGYAGRLYTVISGVFVFVCTNLIFPSLAEAVAAGDEKNEERMINGAVKAVSFITAPLSVGIAVLAPTVTSVIYERGVFTPYDTCLTSTALAGYSAGMVFFGINEVASKAHIAEGYAKIPMLSSVLSMAVSILALPLFAGKLGIGGIAVTSAVAAAVGFAVNCALLKRKHSGILKRRDAADILKSVLSAAIMGGAVRILSECFFSRAVTLAVCVPAGAAVYFILSLLFRSEETAYIKRILTKDKSTG